MGPPARASSAGMPAPASPTSVWHAGLRLAGEGSPSDHDRLCLMAAFGDDEANPPRSCRRAEDEQPWLCRPAARSEAPAEALRVGADPDAEPRPGLRANRAPRELDEADPHEDRPARGREVPGEILGGKLQAITAWSEPPPVDLPVPLEAARRPLPAREEFA